MTTPLIVGQSPGVYTREDDYSGEIVTATTSVGAIVFGSKKGSLVPKLKTSFSGFSAEYGASDIAWGYGHQSADAFFDKGNYLQCLRVVGNGYKYSGANIGYYGSVGANFDVITSQGRGTTGGYESDGGTQIQHTILSIPLLVGSSVSGSLSANGTTIAIPAVPFTISNENTVALLGVAISNAMTTLQAALVAAYPAQANYSAGYAVVDYANIGDIRIVSPENVAVVATFSVANQAGAIFQVNGGNLIDIFAENPGVWGDSLGYNITDIDPGVFQRLALTFSGPFSQGNTLTLNLTVNNLPVVIGPITQPGNTNSDVMVANVAGLIVNAVYNGSNPNGQVAVNTTPGPGNVRVINLIAPLASANYIQLVSYTITGTNAPSLYFAEIMKGVASTNAFTFNVFTRSNTKYPIESFRGTLTQSLDGFGEQLFLDDKVNKSDKKSNNVRVVVNKSVVSSGYFINPLYASSFAVIKFLGGGNDGTLPTNSQILVAWDTFRDVETYFMNILINGGYTDSAVQQNIADIAGTRKDCIAILDVPQDQQSPDTAYVWRTQVSNLNTSYAAIYTPDILILDTVTNMRVFSPQSGHVASRYVYTDNNFATWFAPAGYDRGQLPRALDFRYRYSKPQRDILDSVQLNCGKQAYDGSGRLIFGENTSQVTPTLLSSVAVRRMLIFVENIIAKSLERNLFDLNSAQLGFLIRKRIERFLRPIKDGNGIKNFLVRCDASNNPASFADAGQLNVSVYIVPLRPVKIILLDTVILPSSISFEEFIVNGSL